MKLTMKDKRLIKRFNQAGTQLVISRWPQKGSSYDGIATYTQDTVIRFAKKYGTKFVVLAESGRPGFNSGSSPQAQHNSRSLLELVKPNVLVVRAFNERRIHLYPQVLTWLTAFSKIKQVYVHSEFCASGGPVLRFLVVPFLALIRLTGREITFYAHNVVKSLAGFEQHLGYEKDSWEIKLLSAGYRWYFRLLSIMVSRFVVLEPVVASRLKRLVGWRPVLVEPHWIAPVRKTLAQNEAKKRLGVSTRKKLVVSFGFVTHYKGADFMARLALWMKNRPAYAGVTVALAGGKAYSLKDKQYYEEYYAGIETMAAKLPNLILTGFLSEAEVKLWLTAADVVVFPYRNLMGGSGALQQALRYGKPVLLSRQMAEGLGVEDHDLVFEHTFKSLGGLVRKLMTKQAYRLRVTDFSKQYARDLSVSRLLPKHFDEVYAASQPKPGLLEWGKQVAYAIAPKTA